MINILRYGMKGRKTYIPKRFKRFSNTSGRSWKFKRQHAYKDYDNDGKVNKYDCKPLNPYKQDKFIHYTSKEKAEKIKNEGYIKGKERPEFPISNGEEVFGDKESYFFTKDPKNWKSRTIIKKEGEGNEDRIDFDYDIQDYVTTPKGQTRIELTPVHFKSRKGAKVLKIRNEEDWNKLSTDGYRPNQSQVIEEARKRGYDIIDQKPGKHIERKESVGENDVIALNKRAFIIAEKYPERYDLLGKIGTTKKKKTQ